MFFKKNLLSYILLFFACTSFTHAETDTALMASGQWKDQKTGLIWLRCGVGQKLVGSLCVKSDINKDPLIKAIKNNIDGDLYSTDDNSYLFTYKQAQQILLYLNNQKFKGSNKWRLPTILELVALRQCSIFSTSLMPLFYKGKVYSFPYKCEDLLVNTSNPTFPFNSIYQSKKYLWGFGDLPIWTSTTYVTDGIGKGWTVSTTYGLLDEYNLSAPLNVFLVRSE